jgi:arylsulfatase
MIPDGIDQTALLLLGEGHSRRDYMFHYSGAELAAIRWRHIKAILEGGAHGGLPSMKMTNIRRDPGEKFASMYPYLWTVAPYQALVKSNMQLIEKFPHRVSEATPKGAELTSHD